jgi:secretion/DNA translocation related TadE-like protein
MRRDQQGAVTFAAIGIVATAVMLTLGLARVGGVAVLEARAQAAADAAALAAAEELALGHGDAAARAAASAAARDNGAQFLHCICDPLGAEVEVEIPGHAVLAMPRVVRARARAEIDLTKSRSRETNGP